MAKNPKKQGALRPQHSRTPQHKGLFREHGQNFQKIFAPISVSTFGNNRKRSRRIWKISVREPFRAGSS